jgi:hypothetical protein
MANQVHCAHILVKTETKAKAILERIKKSEKFSSIATQVSLCPSGKKGGDLGKFGRGHREDEVWVPYCKAAGISFGQVFAFLAVEEVSMVFQWVIVGKDMSFTDIFISFETK